MDDVNKKFWSILSGDGPRKFSNTIGSSSLIDTGVRDVNVDQAGKFCKKWQS